MEFSTILFFLSATITVVGALFVAFSSNVLYAGFSLLACFSGVAGLYLGLDASFLAITQILVYVGGIVILILFAVMLSRELGSDPRSALKNLEDERRRLSSTLLAVVVALFVMALVLYVSDATQWEILKEFKTFDTSKGLGELFLGRFLLAFEVSSLLLLGALMGAAVLARPNKEQKPEEEV